MRCAKCGQENPAEAKFCGKCANRLAPAEPAPPMSPGVHRPQPGSEEVSQGLKIGVIIATLFVPLVGIIMGIIYMKEPNPSKQAAGKTWLYVGIGMVVVSCLCVLMSGMLGQMANEY